MEKNKFITEIKSIKDVDIPTFKRLTAFYAVDGKKVHYKGEAVEGIDRNSFEIIRLDLAKDKCTAPKILDTRLKVQFFHE